ncbi:hypothetical protein BKA61DRAFT_711361 [Leptodontidium sp. MPI-SDFR-AT-0119]|nr:hypothetical protein BKA61DRAFT_711361 [Leptodontidium sp. MPI-SDFR-AT-0119]
MTVVFCFQAQLSAAYFGCWTLNGQERLLGSSFGFPGANATFDYVIIGGGTSGLTVAKRLAEDNSLSVVVIEAGGFYEADAGNFSQIPADENIFSEAPVSIDWKISTSPQSQLGGRSISYPHGKCLGGSSGRNGMAYQRGTIGSYQAWADMVDDQSYTFSNLLPYFKKSIIFTPPNYAKRGVHLWPMMHPHSPLLFFKFAPPKPGFSENRGIQSGSLLGFAQYPATLHPDAQIRDSSETSFGQAVILSTSLQIYVRTLAKRILFTGTVATGVTVDTAGAVYTLSARKEVILAAGSFRSPQLLMVSGIGTQDTLKSLNIPVIVNLPGVGQNTWDHPGMGAAYPVNVTTQHQLSSNATYASQAQQSFLINQSWPLTTFDSNYLAWEHLPNSAVANMSIAARNALNAYPQDWPDVQYILSGVDLVTNTPGDYISIGALPLKISSRGNVTINSTDTTDNPIVNVGWLQYKTDQELIIQGFKRCRQIATSMGVVSGPEIAPGITVQTDAQILAYAQASAGPSHHAVSSCRMGNSTDPYAVVDTHGIVRGGISRLRVVDSSIFPLLPPGQPMSTVYMLAEKLAADILRNT